MGRAPQRSVARRVLAVERICRDGDGGLEMGDRRGEEIDMDPSPQRDPSRSKSFPIPPSPSHLGPSRHRIPLLTI